jgi:hypothetical protein
MTFGGFAGARLYIHLMQMIGWLMIALFVWTMAGVQTRSRCRGLAERQRHPQPHPPDHRCQPAARPARHRHRWRWALLGLTLSIQTSGR